MLPEIIRQQLDHRLVKDANRELQYAQQLRGAQSPAIAQQNVVLLLNLYPGEFLQDVQVIGQFLELHQVDLPSPLLLADYRLQSDRCVAMSPAGVVKQDVNLFHWPDCPIRIYSSNKSTHHAMWKTQKVFCVQLVAHELSCIFCGLFMGCSYPTLTLFPCAATCMFTRSGPACAARRD